MKYSVVSKAALVYYASASLAASPVACPPAAVYMFDGSNAQVSNDDTQQPLSVLTNDQTQLVLADFLGTSPLYSATEFGNFSFKPMSGSPFDSKHSDKKAPTAIVVVNGLPDSLVLFNDEKAKYKPAFAIDEAPSPSFFRAWFDRISTDMKQIVSSAGVQQTTDKAVSVITNFVHDIENAAIDGLHDLGILNKRHPMMGNHMGHMMGESDEDEDDKFIESCGGISGQRYKDDITRIKALKSQITDGETALLRVESLHLMLENTKTASKKHYDIAVSKISHALKQLIEETPDLRLFLIAAPADACTNKQRNLLRHCRQSSSLGKREALSEIDLEDRVESSPKVKKVSLGPYDSIEACESATHGCSGHGACAKINKAGTLFACVCKPSVVTNKDGKNSTTRYGGYACQKIDVSVPTQMFLWTSVVLVLALVATVKLVFSLDSEPLPGILNIAKKAN